MISLELRVFLKLSFAYILADSSKMSILPMYKNILPFCVLSHLLDKTRTFEASTEENKIQKLDAGIALGRVSWVLCE